MPDWTAVRHAALDPGLPSMLPADFTPPVLPRAVLEFSRRADDADASPRELGRIIESDAGLTLELLRFANSSSFGLRQAVSSAQHAIGVLGTCRSKLYLLTRALRAAMESLRAPILDLVEFWNVNLERGLFARELAKRIGADPDIAFTGGMIQDFLLPGLIAHSPDKYRAFVEQGHDCRRDLVEFEGENLVWDHAKEAARLLTAWSFPDELVCCTLLHHSGIALISTSALGNTSVAAVAASGLLPDPLLQVPHGLSELAHLEAVLCGFSLLELAEQVDREFRAQVPNRTGYVTLFQRLVAEAPSGPGGARDAKPAPRASFRPAALTTRQRVRS